MATVDDILYRNEKGSALTFAELDDNFYKLALAIDNIQVANNSTVVVRDSVGNFSANTITANLAGNSATTTKFLTARTINGVSFDGTANITLTANTTQTLTRGTYLTGSNFNGGTATTWAVDATNLATASKVVARDASGNFAANTITASLTGNASTATTLQTARTISLSGDVTGSATFDGSANITISTTIAADSLVLGTDTTGNYVASITNGSYITGGNGGSEGAALTLAVDAATAATAGKVVARDASGNFAANTITAGLTGNASTATTLQTARTIGDVSFNGSANILPERIAFKDTRAVDFAPYTYSGVTLHLKTNTTDGLADGATYHGVLNLQHWSDASGGRNYQLGFTDNGNIHHRSSSNTTTWTAWSRLYDTGDASTSATANTLVLRDANGSFSANVITASSITGTISGNAGTATTLQTGRTLTIGNTGKIFDGSIDVSWSLTEIGASPVAGSASLTTLGTVSSGTWNGSVIAGQYGGTGVNNTGRTITLGGNVSTANSFSTSGNFALILTTTAATNVTLPTTGTLATTGNLSQFAATTSAQLAGVISDETGSGVLVFGTSPTFTTSIDSGATFAAFGSSTALTLGYNSTASSTTNISNGAAASGSTKTINIGTAGASGSVTNINIGSATAGAVGNTVINSTSAIIPGNLSVGANILATTGPITNLSTIPATGGSGYMNGTHTNVALTGGTGAGVLATVVVATGVVSSITYTWGGHRYSVGDVLTVPSLATTLATTAASGTGTTATLTFAAQAAAPFEVGSQIIVAGVTPTGYNGTFTVTACTTTTVSYANATTGAQTVAGTVKMGTPLTNATTAAVGAVQGADVYVSSYTSDAIGARIRLETNDTSLVASQELGAIVFASRDATAQASGDIAMIRVLANGTSGGTSFNFLTAPNASAAAVAATLSSAGDFTAVGNVTAYSDERLKSNIRTVNNALDKVTAMRGVYFDKDGKSSVGVIAQEIEKILPEVVLDGDYKSVAYGNIVGVLIEAIKEQQLQIQELQKKLGM